jgi:hypothetical protein
MFVKKYLIQKFIIKNQSNLCFHSDCFNQVGYIPCDILKVKDFSLFVWFHLLLFRLVLDGLGIFDKFFTELLDVSFHQTLILLSEGLFLNQMDSSQL